ncbi:MAG: hypothetical protein ABSG53_10630, partial [Thermoguttaceae bacterium]
MRLRVTEPSGEKASRDHNRTRTGGLVTRPSAGDGPDEYLVRRAMNGEYAIQAICGGAAAPPGPVTVQVDIFTNFGRSNERHRSIVVRLKEKSDTVALGQIQFCGRLQQRHRACVPGNNVAVRAKYSHSEMNVTRNFFGPRIVQCGMRFSTVRSKPRVFRKDDSVMSRFMVLGGVVAAMFSLSITRSAVADETTPGKPAPSANEPVTKQALAVTPKPLSEHVKRGTKWLIEHQLSNGGWGQGVESAQMGGGSQMKDVPSVADSCMAVLALIRAGNTPIQGEYAKNVLHAVEFVCGEIEESDKDSLYVTPTRGTRVQTKLGPYIDTFSAAVLLPEVKDQMPDEAAKKRVAAALDKLLTKIQKNQRPDGTWGGQGWATTIQQGLAVKGLNRAAQFGASVDEKIRARAEGQARQSFDKRSGKFDESGSAGVQLYAAGANLGSVAESVKTNNQRK